MEMLKTSSKSGMLAVKGGRYVCPNCNRTTYQQACPTTQAKGLILWCRHCKAEFIVAIFDIHDKLRHCKAECIVDIEDGQCSIVSPCR